MQKLGHRTSRPIFQPQLKHAVLLGWVILLSLLEVAGRSSRTDVFDAAALLLVGIAAGLTSLVSHGRYRSLSSLAGPYLNQFWEWLKRELNCWGIDFRDEPKLKSALPRTWRILLVGASVATTLAFVGSAWMPHLTRTTLVTHFYLGWLVLWASVCLSALFLIVFQAFIVLGGIHDQLVQRYRGQGKRPPEPERNFVRVVLILTIVAAFCLPVWLALGFMVLFLAIHTVAIAFYGNDLVFTWQDRRQQKLFRLDGRWVMWLQWLPIWTPATLLVLFLRGDSVWGISQTPGLPTLIITTALGQLLAWTAVTGTAVLTAFSLRSLSLSRWANPSRGPCLAPAKFDQPELRKAEIAYRRQITKGLESLFKRAARVKSRTDAGFWLALQHWYILGLMRDEETSPRLTGEETIFDSVVGWPFYQVISQPARHHYWQITKALQIDLIYLEKGISYRKLVPVLRMLFELYDMHAGQRRAEERDFSNLPGLRVVIHDYDSSREPLKLTGYPEPDYEDFSRARILHVFKDRGEETSDEFVPDSTEGLPVFSGAW